MLMTGAAWAGIAAANSSAIINRFIGFFNFQPRLVVRAANIEAARVGRHRLYLTLPVLGAQWAMV
jgi:hypothetical protein